MVNLLKDSSKRVVDVFYEEPFYDGLATDTHLFPLLLAGNRAILFTKNMYGILTKYMWKKFGFGFKALLYLIGFDASENMFATYVKIYGGDKMRTLMFLKEVFRTSGLGLLQFIEVKEGRAVCRVYENFECELLLWLLGRLRHRKIEGNGS